jgi:hypothetical protein
MKTYTPIALLLMLPSVPAMASSEAAELWLNPSVSFDMDKDTSVEIETAQRLRSADDGRADTYFARLWLNQKVAKNVTLSGAIEKRVNDGGADENRIIQQMTTKHGYLRTRFRLEQRFVDNADQMGLRARPRLGVAVPIDADERWAFKTDAEMFLTLRSTSNGGDTGLTGLRTQMGVSYDVTPKFTLSAAYLRQQDFRDRAPDTVGHAPIIGIEYSF